MKTSFILKNKQKRRLNFKKDDHGITKIQMVICIYKAKYSESPSLELIVLKNIKASGSK